jgi:putative glutamine amidotransferase
VKPIIAISFQIADNEPAYMLEKRYVGFIERAGGAALMILPHASFTDIAAIIDNCDGVLIPGGDDINPALYGQERTSFKDDPKPDRDAIEPLIIRHSISRNIPYLGICRGFQMANVALGGTLHQNIATLPEAHLEHWRYDSATQAVHGMKAQPGTLLARIFSTGEFRVNSIHHQAIDEVAPDLVVNGISEDGLVEAVSHPKCDFFLGVQWHPEFAPDAAFSDPLGRAFIEACEARRNARSKQSAAEQPD